MGKHSKEEDIKKSKKTLKPKKTSDVRELIHDEEDDINTITVTVKGKKVEEKNNSKKANTKVATNNKNTSNKNSNLVPHKRIGNRIAKTITILTILVLTGVGILGLVNKVKANGGGLTGILTTALGEDKVDVDKLEPIQVLIVGISGVDEWKLADTIMIASYNPKTQTAGLISIPRDTYVGQQDRHSASQLYLQSYKINAVYRNGTNLEGMMNRINALTGLNIQKYVVIDTAALRKLVDTIGGVEYEVPIDMWYTDDSQGLKIELYAGKQILDGAKAEQLVRFRHNDDDSTYPSSYGQQDLGRMKTQRAFVTETLKQTLKPQNLFKIRQIVDIMQNNVNTNIDFATLKQYLPYAVEFDVENLKTGALEGSVEMCNGVSIMVVSQYRAKNTVNEIFGLNESEE